MKKNFALSTKMGLKKEMKIRHAAVIFFFNFSPAFCNKASDGDSLAQPAGGRTAVPVYRNNGFFKSNVLLTRVCPSSAQISTS